MIHVRAEHQRRRGGAHAATPQLEVAGRVAAQREVRVARGEIAHPGDHRAFAIRRGGPRHRARGDPEHARAADRRAPPGQREPSRRLPERSLDLAREPESVRRSRRPLVRREQPRSNRVAAAEFLEPEGPVAPFQRVEHEGACARAGGARRAHRSRRGGRDGRRSPRRVRRRRCRRARRRAGPGRCQPVASRAPIERPDASSLAVRSATAPRSALFTANTSGCSRMPAFMNCSTSPAPGCATKTSVSTSPATSASDCPTPTVSTKTRSKTAASTATAGQVASASPPSRSRAAIERRKTPRVAGARAHARAIAEQRAARDATRRDRPR